MGLPGNHPLICSAAGPTRMGDMVWWWPEEKPVGTIAGFLVIAGLAKAVHRIGFEVSASFPSTGPALVVVNHLAVTETLAVARLVTGHHRYPHFLAEAEVFRVPVIGAALRLGRQIPVERGGPRAADALAGAALEFDRGHVVCLYPEGRLTRRPDLLPDRGHTGVARLALERPEVPVIPVGQWGPRPGKRQILRRRRVRLVVGDPLDLTAWRDRPVTAELLREMTDHITDVITSLVLVARQQLDSDSRSGGGRRRPTGHRRSRSG